MRFCVVGAGAIGGLMGARLALAGEDVTLIARGDHLSAIRGSGLTVVSADGTEEVATSCKATDDLRQAGKQDIIIIALKAHQIEQVAADIPAMFDADTVVVPVQNGIPWWYFYKHGGELDGTRLTSLDPSGVIGTHVDAQRIIGCISYPAAEKSEPGVIHHVEGNRFPVGEPDGTESARVKMVAERFTAAGFKSRVLTDIRAQIWLKAWGNLSFNPISALTRATLVEICQFSETRELSANMMQEAQDIAHKLGIEFRHTIEQRIAGAEKVGAHKTSMLQDVEAGRSIEIEALVGAVIELGQLTDTPTPSISAVYACTKLLAQKALGR